MESLIVTYLIWIVVQTGWSLPQQPTIQFIKKSEMAARFGSPPNATFDIQAMYNRNEATILLPQEWQADDLRQKSALLHELVHHVQKFNSVNLPCIAAYERQAYNLQIKWLREQGVIDPYGLIGINELGIYVVSACND